MSSRSTARPAQLPPAPGAGGQGRARRHGPASPAACSPWSAASPTARASSTAPRRRMRQPGSSFKPFVYAAALDNGYTPSSIVLDAPIEIDQGGGRGVWRRRTTAASSPARDAAHRHREVAQRHDRAARPGHRHAADRRICRALRRLRRHAAACSPMALGAGETTVLRMTAAYAMLANGGRRSSRR